MERMSRKHDVRRRVFRTCGVALIASVLLAATPGSSGQPRHEPGERLPRRGASSQGTYVKGGKDHAHIDPLWENAADWGPRP